MRRQTKIVDRRELRTEWKRLASYDDVVARKDSDPFAAAIWNAWSKHTPLNLSQFEDYAHTF